MVAQLQIRKAVESDLAGILALYRELRPHDPVLAPTVAREAFTSLLSQSNVHLMVCEVGNMLVATCMLAVIPNIASGARPFGVIEHVVTLTSHRKRGYARLVLERALAEAWAGGCCKVMLLSGVKREEAHKLYESVGFLADVERGFVVKPGMRSNTSLERTRDR